MMQLGETEALGVLDDHHRGIGNIDADFDHSGGDEHPDAAVPKSAHDLVPLHCGHFAMYQANAELFEHSLAHFFRHLRRIADLSELLGGLNLRIDDKGLTSST